MFWQLILLVERSAEAVLGWSWWRRHHQAQAQTHHYCTRASRAAGATPPQPAEPAEPAQPAVGSVSELVEQVWRRLQPLLPRYERGGRPYTHDRRVIVAAIVHQMQTGCAWNALPKHFPPYQTVHTQLRRWQKSGIWAKIWDGMAQPILAG